MTTMASGRSNRTQPNPHLDPQRERQSTFSETLRNLPKFSDDTPSPRSSVISFPHSSSSTGRRFSLFKTSKSARPSTSASVIGSSPTSGYSENSSSKAVFVSSIINGMYGRPEKLKVPSNTSSGSSDLYSRPMKGQHEASSSKLDVHRGSSDSLSQPSLKKVPSSPRNWIASAAMSVKSGRSSSNRSTGSAEFRAGSSEMSSESQASSSTTSSPPSVRIVGRGGSGSRLRLASISTNDLHSPILRSDQPPPPRPAGRGGFASRPKPLEPIPDPSEEIVKQRAAATQPPVQPTRFVRPVGRGGAGSRPKTAGDSSTSVSLLRIISMRKTKSSKNLKGKGKDPSEVRRAIHPIPPSLSYQITNANASSSTLSTIHFEGETGSPEVPFFPQGSLPRSSPSDETSTSQEFPTASSSTYENTPSTSRTTLDDLDVDGESDFEQQRNAHRERSRNKLERTLGDLPRNNTFAFPHNPPSSKPKEQLPKLLIDPNPPSTKDKGSKIFRRSSLSVSSLGSMFSRNSAKTGQVSESSHSQHTLSTLTDDLHQFGLEDDLSDSWGEVNRNSTYSSVAGSPIVFSPPSPIPVKRSASPHPPLSSPDTPTVSVPRPLPVPPVLLPKQLEVVAPKTQEGEDQFFVAPSPTLGRSFSYSRHRRSIRVPTHTASASLHTDIRLDSNGVALRSNWIVPPSADDPKDVAFSVREVPDIASQAWSGEWNTNLPEVIKSLRTLR
ncbi:hypothetical protein CPC08DRAFT_427901 [Agrocybe pediades]|nr:hypothetical protein CPC08DRAFT_427901 [Agrocybe pediades]